MLELQSISLANCVIENDPFEFNEINFLSLSDASVSKIFPTPCLLSSEFCYPEYLLQFHIQQFGYLVCRSQHI